MNLLIGQATPDTSSAAAVVFGVVALVGALSVVALTSKGRRTLLPLVAVALGLLIGATTITESRLSTFTALTVIGMFFAVLLVIGGLGAFREGLAVPDVEGTEPQIHPSAPSNTPND